MRRWLTILLLVMLPFQFTWAAAASYCQHETAPETQHIGHHQHEHKAASDAGKVKTDAQDAKSTKLVADNDCGYCHLNAAKSVQLQALEVPALKGPAVQDAAVQPLPTRDPERHERPNWRLA
ncbi:MAG: DUF2946 family protein [Rhizobacter sp.]|nr:DUF2946 family protein [Rhizobacter sp.]